MRRARIGVAASMALALLLPAPQAHAANANVTLPSSFSIAPNTADQNLNLGNSVISNLSGTIVVAIKLKNAMYGEFLKQPTTTGLTITDAYGGSVTSGFYERSEERRVGKECRL